MKECTNDYFEEDIADNDLTDALERENAAILEIELEMENEPKVSRIPETSTRKKLKREMEQEALARLEDSARTEEEFANVVTWWNRLDANRERKKSQIPFDLVGHAWYDSNIFSDDTDYILKQTDWRIL